MTGARELKIVSIADYLAGELVSKIKREYLGGYVHAMARATNSHNLVATNVTGLLHAQLRGKPCIAFNSDTKARIDLPLHTRFCYPDCMVVCEASQGAASYQEEPVLLAEVLSASTRRTDLVGKRDAYLTLPSLEYYLLIEPIEPKVIMYRRDEAYFAAEVYEGLDAVISLPALDCELSLAELYERVDFAVARQEDDALWREINE